MIAYNIEWLDALLTKDTARIWHEKGLISTEQWQALQERHASKFYSPNLFIRIGLAIFCMILLSSTGGMLTMITMPESTMGWSFYSLFWGGLCFAVLESWAIRKAFHKGSGVDDLLLYTATGAILMGIYGVFDFDVPMLVSCFIAWPLLVLGSVRYLDRLMAVGAFVCSLLIILLMVKDIPRLALYLLPFAGMLFSAGAYVFAWKGQRKYAWRHWIGVLTVVELLSLVTFYASGNYWVIQQSGAAWFELEQVPMAGFFWLFTFAVPFVYIIMGLRGKDRPLLDIGLGCVAAAVFSFRYFYHVMSFSWALVIAGAVLFATAYFSIRYLNKKAGAYTYEEESETTMLQEIEEQLIEQTIANQPGPKPDKADSFGGGQFGGGGAGAEY